MNRRQLPTIRNGLILPWLLLASASALAGSVNDDGLHEQPWFLHSFLELREDWQAAVADGKHFAIIWELKGCPACQRLHQDLLSRPVIAAAIAPHFDLLQLNIIGARRVTDFDGERIGEKALASRLGVQGTPTIQIFAADAAAGASAPREVMRIEGVPPRDRFLAMFRYVSGGAYRHQPFEAYWQQQAATDRRSRT